MNFTWKQDSQEVGTTIQDIKLKLDEDQPMPLISLIVKVEDQDDVEMMRNLVEPGLPEGVVLLSSYYDLINYNF